MKQLKLKIAICFLMLSSFCFAAENDTITEHVGEPLDLAAVWKNEKGESVKLSDLINKKPVLLSIIYYACPGLCNVHLNGVTETLKKIDLKPGQDFEIFVVSFDANEKHEIAAAKKASYLKQYGGGPEAENGWHFLTGDQKSIQTLTQQVGFKFERDSQTNLWNHSSAAIFISSEGRIVRYLQGSYFSPRNMQLAIVEAGQENTGSFADRLVLRFLEYDIVKGDYVLSARNLSALGGAVMISLGFILLGARKKK